MINTKTEYGVYREWTKNAILSEEIFNVFNEKQNYQLLLGNKTTAVLIDSMLNSLSEYFELKLNDKANEKDIKIFNGYRKVLEKFSDIAKKHKSIKIDKDVIGNLLAPSERNFFANKAKPGIVEPREKAYFNNEEFYKAIRTNIGKKLFDFVKKEREGMLSSVFGSKNGFDNGYCVAITKIYAEWASRIDVFEKTTKEVKFFNRSMRNGR